MGKYNKEELEKLILDENLSYEEVGRRFGCTGANIKKVAARLGIELLQRRKINSCETFDREDRKREKRYCLNCGNDITHKPANKYCNNICQGEYLHKQKIQDWKDGKFDGISGKDQLSTHVKQYLFEKYNNKCYACEWGEINVYSGLIPLQVHHIDGDCLNNLEENLILLCPNCHSLTKNYGSRNKNSTRIRR